MPDIPPPKLYRYMTHEAAIATLMSRQFRISEPHLVNDPFEFAVSRKLREEQKRINGYDIYKSLENVGFLSFSEQGRNIQMWGNYADGHGGVCFEFEFELNEDNSFPITHLAIDNKGELTPREAVAYLLKVNSQDSLFSLEDYKNTASGTEVFNQISSRKASQWVHEDEWRVTVELIHCVAGEDGRRYLSLDQFKSSIKGIFIGCKNPYPKDYWSNLLSQATGRAVPVKLLKMNDENYKLEEIND